MTSQKVGFIGLGNIGKPMAKNLLGQSFGAMVFDVFPAACEEFKAAGAEIANPAEMGAQCEVIGVCVRDDKDVENVLCGADGILTNPKPGLVVAIHSTVRPETVYRMAELAAAKQVSVIDAPITGGAGGAEKRALCYMVGGDEATVEKAKLLFNTSAKEIVHAGGLGCGMALKLANNMMTYAKFTCGYEAMRLAKSAGIKPELLKQVGAANGNIPEHVSQFLLLMEVKPQIKPEDFAKLVAGYIAVAEKDLTVALEVARANGLTLPQAENSLELIAKVYGCEY
jgi:3-hydroxyisobutyrate dehydrogenase